MDDRSHRADSRAMKADDGARALNDDQRYAVAWRSLRARRWAVGILVLAGLPVVIGALRLLPEGPGQVAVAGGWMALFVASMIWMAAFRCPCCARFFWWTWTRRNPFAQKCLHCGTPAGATPSDASTMAGASEPLPVRRAYRL